MLSPKTFTPASVSIPQSSISFPGHDFVTGGTCTFSSDGTLPTGLNASDTFYIQVDGPDTVSIAISEGGLADGSGILSFTDGGSGTHTLTPTS